MCVFKQNIFYKRCEILTEHFIADTVDFINFPVFSPSDLEIKPNFTNTLTFLISGAVEIILILIYGTEQRSSWHPCRPVVWLTLAVYMLSAERRVRQYEVRSQCKLICVTSFTRRCWKLCCCLWWTVYTVRVISNDTKYLLKKRFHCLYALLCFRIQEVLIGSHTVANDNV